MAKRKADQQQDKALNTYWNAREAILSEDLWGEENDHRLANLMKLTERIEAWYPGLKEARDRNEFKRLSEEKGSVIDLSVMRNPGPSSDLIRDFRNKRELQLNLYGPSYNESERLRDYKANKVLNVYGFPMLSQDIWDRIIDNKTSFGVKFPISAIGDAQLAAGWFLCLWDVKEGFAWVSPDEGPWKPFLDKKIGIWIPISRTGLNIDFESEWNFGHRLPLDIIRAPSMKEKSEWRELCTLDSCEDRMREQRSPSSPYTTTRHYG